MSKMSDIEGVFYYENRIAQRVADIILTAFYGKLFCRNFRQEIIISEETDRDILDRGNGSLHRRRLPAGKSLCRTCGITERKMRSYCRTQDYVLRIRRIAVSETQRAAGAHRR